MTDGSTDIASRLRRLREDPILRRLVARAGPNTLSTIGSAILGMVRSSILMRALGVVDFGRLAILIAATAIVKQLCSVRAWEWTTVELTTASVAKDSVRLRSVVRASASIGIVTSLVSVLVIAAISPFSWWRGNSEVELGPLLVVYGLVHLATVFDDLAMATLRTAGWFPFLARQQLGAAIFRVITTLPLLFVEGAGLGAAVAATLLAQYPTSLWLVLKSRRALHTLTPEIETETPLPSLRSEWRRHLRTLATLSLTDTTRSFAVDADPVIVGHLSNETEVGELKATTTLITGMLGLAVPLYMAFYPELARAVVERDAEKTRALIRRLALLGGAMAFLAALGTFLFGPFLLVAIYGDALSDAIPDLRIMGLAMVGLVAHWSIPLFTTLGRPLRVSITALGGVLVKGALFFAFVPSLGSTGAAIAFVGYHAATVVISLFLARGYAEELRDGQPKQT